MDTEYKDLYNYVFIFERYTLTIEAESKKKAIEILSVDYSRLFEENFKCIKIDRSIKNDGSEISYL